MRLTLKVVADNHKAIAQVLEDLAEELRRGHMTSNAGGGHPTEHGYATIDFDFTNCNDVYADISDCIVISPYGDDN